MMHKWKFLKQKGVWKCSCGYVEPKQISEQIGRKTPEERAYELRYSREMA